MLGRLRAAGLAVPPPGLVTGPDTFQPELQLAVIADTDKRSLKRIRKGKDIENQSGFPKKEPIWRTHSTSFQDLLRSYRHQDGVLLSRQTDSRNSTESRNRRTHMDS